MKDFNQFLNENLRFEDSDKTEQDLSNLLEIYQEYYDNLETAKVATYDPETLDTLNSILDGIDQAVQGIKKIKK